MVLWLWVKFLLLMLSFDWIVGMLVFLVFQYVGQVGVVEVVVCVVLFWFVFEQWEGVVVLVGGVVDVDCVVVDEGGVGGEQEDDGGGDF